MLRRHIIFQRLGLRIGDVPAKVQRYRGFAAFFEVFWNALREGTHTTVTKAMGDFLTGLPLQEPQNFGLCSAWGNSILFTDETNKVIEVGIMWVVYALLSALFAGLVAIFAKIGIENVNSNLAVAIRTVVILAMAWAIVFVTGKHDEIQNIGQKSWVFLILSGFATGLSWLFYYKALQIGPVSKVVPIDKLSIVIAMVLAFVVFHETADAKTIIGGLLIALGTLVLVL